jgi:purine-binding chemotaxis protein CheW
MDLAASFGRPAATLTRRTCIVVVEIATEGERRDVGMVVDAVSAVQDIAARDIEPPPALGGRIKGDFIRGMGKVDGRFVIILDAARVLSDEGFATSANAGTNEDVP